MAQTRIQVVEDEAIISLQIQDMLRSMGYSVCGKASSGREAIEKAGEIHPDLMLMDVRLKEPMDGIEAARQILERFNIPVIFKRYEFPTKENNGNDFTPFRHSRDDVFRGH